MRLYHGSYCRIECIDLSLARKYKDFGVGFYLTPAFQRAVKMAMRSVELNQEGAPEVNAYLFYKSNCPKEVKIKEFKTCNWEWAEFVMKNRDKSQNPPYKHEYDIVIGPVADSSVDSEIRMYREEYGNAYLNRECLKQLASRLKYSGERYVQYCFCTEKALKQLIRDN